MEKDHGENNVWSSAQRCVSAVQLKDKKKKKIHGESNVWSTAQR